MGFTFFYFFLYIYYFGQKNDDDIMSVNCLLTLPIFVGWFFYFALLESINQATPGHDICKLIAVKTNGERITFLTALKRRIVDPFDIFLYGIPALICINNTPKFQRLGDLLADTVVVKKSDIIETGAAF